MEIYWDALKLFAPDLFEALEIIKVETGLIKNGNLVMCDGCIRVTFKEGKKPFSIRTQDYVFAPEYSDIYDKLLNVLIILAKNVEFDAFEEKREIKMVKYVVQY